MNVLRIVLLALALLLTGATSALAAPLHQGLGDVALASEPRDIAGDLDADRLPLATPHQPGCITDLISTNFSSRGGVRPQMNVAHLTVSRNTEGWGDVNAIRGWFNQSRAQASSNYIVDDEGNCKLIVPETAKAWTQGAFNPSSISIEFIHFSTTNPNEKWTEAQLRKGARIFADSSKRWNLPIRLVNPSGCTPVRGLTDHDRLDCGNSHVDVGTVQPGAGVHTGTFPMTKFIRYVREAAAPPPLPTIYFTLVGPGGEVNAKSGSAVVGHDSEAARLWDFLANRRRTIVSRLQASGSITIVRHKAKPAFFPGEKGRIARVFYQLIGPAGGVNATSGFAAGLDAEMRRVGLFLKNHNETITTRLERSGSIVLTRKAG